MDRNRGVDRSSNPPNSRHGCEASAAARDSSIVANLFDERDPAVKKLLALAIKTAREKGKYVGICGQGPSDHPDLARWLMEQGIDSLSLNPDTVVSTWTALAGNPAKPKPQSAAA